MQSPTKNPVGASSVALGEWLMSPGNSNMGISPSRTTGHDIHFSPGMFSPTKSMGISLSAQGMGPVSSAFSPSMFSPASSRLLKKRHLYSPQGERALLYVNCVSPPAFSFHTALPFSNLYKLFLLIPAHAVWAKMALRHLRVNM